MRFRLRTLLTLTTLACVILAAILGLWRFAVQIDAIFKG
jgi:hypothetical protein